LPQSGCTGWLVSNGAVLTAGHCPVAVGDVLEFNVPASNANGTINSANVNDQYPVTSISTVVNGGLGNDYQVLAIGPNSITKSRAHVVNGFFRMVNTTPANGSIIRVTGFGLDNAPNGTGGVGAACCDIDGDSVCDNNCNSASQTEQTHTATYAGLTGTSHTYTVDTTPANSGSPIIWEAFGVTIGIHTNGGCTSTGGSNSGTAFGSVGLRNAIRDFPGPLAIYVDAGVSGLPQNGGVFEPYTHVWQAVSAVQNGGIVSIVKGNYPASSGETFIAGGGFKAMTLEAPVGTVTIGN
jgi:V8-like Glu-specific endopeptidase